MKFQAIYNEGRVCTIEADSLKQANERFTRFRREGATVGIISDLSLNDDVRGDIGCIDEPDPEAHPILFPAVPKCERHIRTRAADGRPFLEKCADLTRLTEESVIRARLTTEDGRIDYTFDATLYFDHLPLPAVETINPASPGEALNIPEMLLVCSLWDTNLANIAHAYNDINRHLAAIKGVCVVGSASKIRMKVSLSHDEVREYLAERRRLDAKSA